MPNEKIKRSLHEIPPLPDSLWQNPLHFIAFGFGTGALPIAPGTFGTLLAIPFYLLIHRFTLPWYVLTTLLVIIASIWICHRVSKDIALHDHQGMCLDEFPGFLVTMCGIPTGIGWIIAGFLLFRLFDIWKPWPIRFIDEKISGGIGMILDDVLAGVYACIILHFVARIMG